MTKQAIEKTRLTFEAWASKQIIDTFPKKKKTQILRTLAQPAEEASKHFNIPVDNLAMQYLMTGGSENVVAVYDQNTSQLPIIKQIQQDLKEEIESVTKKE